MDRDTGQLAGRPLKGENGNDLRRALGLRIERLRRWHGMVQQDLASALGVAACMVTRYETGQYAPRLEVLVRLRRVFSCTLDHLVLGERIAEVTDVRLLARLRRMDGLPAEHKAGLFRLIDTYLDVHETPSAPGTAVRTRRLETQAEP